MGATSAVSSKVITEDRSCARALQESALSFDVLSGCLDLSARGIQLRSGGVVVRLRERLLLIETRYNWPGSIRELQNLIERSVILTTGSTLHVALPDLTEQAGVYPLPERSSTAQAAERDRIIRALEEAKGQVGGPHGAAARLGLKRTTLQSRMRKYNIARQYC
jgi:formate hydrogenlyase transcriptional activator